MLLLHLNAPFFALKCSISLKSFHRARIMLVIKTLDCGQSLFFFRFSESNARARERRSRETRETRAAASPVSRHQSRAWPFACLAFCSTDYSRQERLLVVYIADRYIWPFMCIVSTRIDSSDNLLAVLVTSHRLVFKANFFK